MSPETTTQRLWNEWRSQAGYLPPSAPEPLLAKLKRGNDQERYQAAVYAALIKDPRTVRALIEALRDSQFEVVSAVVVGLGVFGGTQAVGPLEDLFHRSSRVELRRNILYSLANIGSPAIPTLIQLLREGHRDVWDHMAFALGEVGKPMVGPLIKAMNSFNFEQNLCAHLALGEIGRSAAPVIAAALHDPRLPEETRKWLSQALERISG